MADHFEEAKDDILFRTEGNGGPSPRDLLTAMGALAKDVDEAITSLDKKQHQRHNETVAEMKALRNAGNVRDRRLNVIEKQHTTWEEECPRRLEAIIDEAVKRSTGEHSTTHAAHMAEHHIQPRRREDDAAGENHRHERSDFPTGDQRTLFELILGWSIVKWLIAGACMALVVWGVAFWASSCAEQAEHAKARGEIQLLASPSP